MKLPLYTPIIQYHHVLDNIITNDDRQAYLDLLFTPKGNDYYYYIQNLMDIFLCYFQVFGQFSWIYIHPWHRWKRSQPKSVKTKSQGAVDYSKCNYHAFLKFLIALLFSFLRNKHLIVQFSSTRDDVNFVIRISFCYFSVRLL